MAEPSKQELMIKNMVCPRCVMVVREALESLGLKVYEVALGKATVGNINRTNKIKLREKLEKYGFELIDGQHQRLVEQIKQLLIKYIQQLKDTEKSPRFSEFLSKELNQNYSSLSSVFSENEGITIEKYLIHLKIERVKELLSYGELTLSEIAYKLNYSSVAHLSSQFKKITGMSVTDYKKARDSFRQPLDGIKE